MENTVNYKEAIRDCKNKKGIEQINRPNTLKDQKCTIFHVEHINVRKRSSTLLAHDKVSKARRLILRTRDEQEALGHADRVREMNTVINFPSASSQKFMENYPFQKLQLECDISTIARATFPDFFPRGPVQDSYDCFSMQPKLEDIFSKGSMSRDGKLTH